MVGSHWYDVTHCMVVNCICSKWHDHHWELENSLLEDSSRAIVSSNGRQLTCWEDTRVFDGAYQMVQNLILCEKMMIRCKVF